ncbi:MAG: hypothetical protein C0617_00355 [Desulfuromonas sp.]|nr:MAG: hypothetical protein C0617_00355 [Desulfuromonas sp.]
MFQRSEFLPAPETPAERREPAIAIGDSGLGDGGALGSRGLGEQSPVACGGESPQHARRDART